jgi:predicted transcriptional regulator
MEYYSINPRNVECEVIKVMILDYEALKKYIEKVGLKQKAIAQKANMPEARLCLILQGKRKCEVGEYARICSSLGVEIDRFIAGE